MTSFRSCVIATVLVYLSVVVLFHTQLRLTGTGNNSNAVPDETRHQNTRVLDESLARSVETPITAVPTRQPGKSTFTSTVPLFGHCSDRYNGTVPSSSTFQPVGRHFVFSAYLDDRLDAWSLRIIALVRNDGITQPTFNCHVTSGELHDANTDTGRHASYRKWSVSAEVYEMCENHAKEYGGWILSCRLPSSFKTLRPPCQVSVSTPGAGIGMATLPVYRLSNETVQRHLAVCLPPLFGHVPSTTVVEFIELSRLLGIDHFVVYRVAQLASEVTKTLDYYSELGLVTVINWDLPVDEKLVWYRGQLVAINDCMYRSMHAFNYLSFNDIDEFIVPHKHRHLPAMLDNLRRITSAVNLTGRPLEHCGYSFQSAFFDPMLSGPTTHVLYDLESDLRTKAFSRVRTKVIVRPSAMFEVGIHHVSRPLVEPVHLSTETASGRVNGNDSGGGVLYVDTDVAYIHHYRKCSSEFDYKMNCQIYVRDEGLSRFIPALRHTVHQTLWTLKDREDQRQGEQIRLVR